MCLWVLLLWGGGEGGFLGITVDLNSCLRIDFLEFLKGVCRFPGGATHLSLGDHGGPPFCPR
jgi:hypothetical protein